jgi:hypothetical protein
MQKFTTTLMLVVMASTIFSQSISRKVISPLGGSGSNSQATVSWTAGEPIVTTATNGTITLTQGFEQSTTECHCCAETEDPVINNCPDNINSCDANTFWPPPTATDNCNLVSFDRDISTTFNGQTVIYTATDEEGNQSTCQFSITIHSLPTADAGADVAINPGDSTIIGGSPTGNGGSSPYTYVWFPTTSLDSADVDNPLATPIETTNYTVFVLDTNGCAATDDLTVTVITLLTGNASDKSEEDSPHNSDVIDNDLQPVFRTTVFPNPTDARVLVEMQGIHLDGEVKSQITLFDVFGKEVYHWEVLSSPTLTHPIDLSQLAQGQYFVQCTMDGLLSYEKVVLIK